ncbi:hypothetical protein DNK47_02705 [Mycoplasma wenyonii]|uniref:Uncharacterized protein n=1 Tax=Mycoplasma wenyonii TaxID=65123 RepID=A0A328PK83_9MOLU|nr:hypothetical protein [Mycoplasma wenyonii]RAO94884.1 hypothetical protein DNK47_02705 [Mycoplasma wenyonii]
MLAIFKLVIGVAGVGAGVGVPVMVNRIVSTTGRAVQAVNESHIVKTIRQEITENKENEKLLEALKDLASKNCKLVKNSQNPNNSFESLYACRESDNVFNFYYLGKREEVKKNGVSEVKKVKTLSYEKESNNHNLVLTLEDKEQSVTNTVIKMGVADQNGGGWAHFKNVDLSSSCKVAKPILGSDILECKLTEDGTSSYSFSIL